MSTGSYNFVERLKRDLMSDYEQHIGLDFEFPQEFIDDRIDFAINEFEKVFHDKIEGAELDAQIRGTTIPYSAGMYATAEDLYVPITGLVLLKDNKGRKAEKVKELLLDNLLESVELILNTNEDYHIRYIKLLESLKESKGAKSANE